MRFLIAGVVAPLVTFTLLAFMAGLISQADNQQQQYQDNPYFDLLVTTQDEVFESRTRQKLKPPEPQTQQSIEPVEMLQSQVSSPDINVALEVPSLDLSNNVSAMSISMPGIENMQLPVQGTTSGEMMAMPLYRVEPRYPRKALRLNKQGYVLLSFDINESGRVVNIQVIDANPRKLFEREAQRALKRWKYKPMLINGEAVSQIGQKIRLDFKMESAS